MGETEIREEGDKARPPRRGKPISVEAAIFLFGLLNAGCDREVIERAVKLALRDLDLIGGTARGWLGAEGFDVEALTSGDPSTPLSKAEVMEIVEPALKKGVEMATFAQLADIYLFRADLTPENLVYAFYNGIRFAISQEKRRRRTCRQCRTRQGIRSGACNALRGHQRPCRRGRT